MKKTAIGLAAIALGAIAPLPASANVIVGATAVSSPQGDFGGSFALTNIIDQSGLSAGYTSGVTAFDPYTAGTTHLGLTGTGFTNSETQGPQQFTFDLGAELTIDAIAIWNTDSVGRVTRMRVLYDSDADFANGTSGELVGPSGLGGFGPAQVFAFAPTATRYVHVEGLASLEPPDFYGLAEVAFRSLPGTSVPLPGTLALLGLGLAGVVTSRRARR